MILPITSNRQTKSEIRDPTLFERQNHRDFSPTDTYFKLSKIKVIIGFILRIFIANKLSLKRIGYWN